MRRFAWLCCILACAAPQMVRAQSGLTYGLDAGMIWSRTDTSGVTANYGGPFLAGHGGFDFGPVVAGLSLLEGRLNPKDQVGGARKDLVQGSLFLGAKPASWFTVTFGPEIRAYVMDNQTERWVSWQIRTRGELPVVAPGLSSYVELFRAVSATVNDPAGAGRVQGGKAGIVYRTAGALSAALEYHIDDARLKTPNHTQTLEALRLSVTWGSW
jgi:hypothetical protein